MSLRQATLSGAFVGRSAKTVRMPWYASGSRLLFVNDHPFPPATTTGTTLNTKTAWTQYIASTSADANLLYYTPAATQYATDSAAMVDIGIGAAGSETVIVPDLPIGNWGFSNVPAIPIPVFVPAGSRVAIRAQTGSASRSVVGYLALLDAESNSHITPRAVDVIGGVPATSRGTALAGASNSYTELASSTTKPYQAFVVIPSSATVSGGINGNFRLTLARGAAGAEVDLGFVSFSQGSNGSLSNAGMNNVGYGYMIIGTPLPAGVRLSIKHNIASSPERLQVAIIGVPFR